MPKPSPFTYKLPSKTGFSEYGRNYKSVTRSKTLTPSSPSKYKETTKMPESPVPGYASTYAVTMEWIRWTIVANEPWHRVVGACSVSKKEILTTDHQMLPVSMILAIIETMGRVLESRMPSQRKGQKWSWWVGVSSAQTQPMAIATEPRQSRTVMRLSSIRSKGWLIQ